MKAGIKTTEFWAPIVFVILSGALYLVTTFAGADSTWAGVLTSILTGGASLGLWQYVKGRGSLKESENIKASLQAAQKSKGEGSGDNPPL